MSPGGLPVSLFTMSVTFHGVTRYRFSVLGLPVSPCSRSGSSGSAVALRKLHSPEQKLAHTLSIEAWSVGTAEVLSPGTQVFMADTAVATVASTKSWRIIVPVLLPAVQNRCVALCTELPASRTAARMTPEGSPKLWARRGVQRQLSAACRASAKEFLQFKELVEGDSRNRDRGARSRSLPQMEPAPSSARTVAVHAVVAGGGGASSACGGARLPQTSSSHSDGSGPDRARINPKYLHTNSTSHQWAFGAFAELIDNAVDAEAGATQMVIDGTNGSQAAGHPSAVTFTDNGRGMNAGRLENMMSFGYSSKEGNQIGQYGNGFKSGSMRLGDDALVATITETSCSCGLISRTYLAEIQAEEVLIPFVHYDVLPAQASDTKFSDRLTVAVPQDPCSCCAFLKVPQVNFCC